MTRAMRAAWCASILGIVAAYGGAVLPQRRQLQELGTEATRLYETANRNEHAAADEPRVRSERRRLTEAILRDVGGTAPPEAASTVAMLAAAARASDIRVVSIHPSAPEKPRTASVIDSAGVDVVVEGPFRNVLGMIFQLGDAERLYALNGLTFLPAPATAQGPRVNADLKLVLCSLSQNWQEEIARDNPGTLR